MKNSPALKCSVLLARLLLCGVLTSCSGMADIASAEKLTVEKPRRKVQPSTIGWVERVRTLPDALELEAKLSPSVALSSLHADNLKEFKKKGKDYVSFQIEDRHGKRKTFEFPLVAQKKTKTADGDTHKRKVIMFPICLAGQKFDTEVLLSDRSSLEQELRVGRNDLAGHFVVDPSRTHMTTPKCNNSDS